MPPYYCLCPESGVHIYWVFGALLIGLLTPALIDIFTSKHEESVAARELASTQRILFGIVGLLVVWGCAAALDQPVSGSNTNWEKTEL
jgi:hypothetical protein